MWYACHKLTYQNGAKPLAHPSSQSNDPPKKIKIKVFVIFIYLYSKVQINQKFGKHLYFLFSVKNIMYNTHQIFQWDSKIQVGIPQVW